MTANKQWVWLSAQTLKTVHDEQLAEHGGGAGVRDLTLFESALGRPQNLAAYESPDAFSLAASYGYGIAKNHPFVDGNKRTAFVAVELFLLLNGFELFADDVSCVMTMLQVASGDLSEPDFAAWIRVNSQPLA